MRKDEGWMDYFFRDIECEGIILNSETGGREAILGITVNLINFSKIILYKPKKKKTFFFSSAKSI